MHRRGGADTTVPSFFGTQSGSILPRCFDIVFEANFGLLLVLKSVPKRQQNRSNFRIKVALRLVARLRHFRIKCFLQTTMSDLPNTLFFHGFSTISFIRILLSLSVVSCSCCSKWVHLGLLMCSKTSSKLVYKIVSQLYRFGVSFWLDLGTLLEAFWGP